jgi:hypothetical protein
MRKRLKVIQYHAFNLSKSLLIAALKSLSVFSIYLSLGEFHHPVLLFLSLNFSTQLLTLFLKQMRSGIKVELNRNNRGTRIRFYALSSSI